MRIYGKNQGFSLVEVLVSLVIIVGIASFAYQYHLNVINDNRALARIQQALFLSDSQFDVEYGLAEQWRR